MTEMRTAIHNEGEAVYQCVPLGAHLAEVARLEAENKRLRDALESARMYAVYLEDALYRKRRTVISLERL